MLKDSKSWHIKVSPHRKRLSIRIKVTFGTVYAKENKYLQDFEIVPEIKIYVSEKKHSRTDLPLYGGWALAHFSEINRPVAPLLDYSSLKIIKRDKDFAENDPYLIKLTAIRILGLNIQMKKSSKS